MVVEKQTDNSNLPDLETQSALLITTKERVNYFYISNEKSLNLYSRLEHFFSQIFLIENLFSINYRIYYHNIMKQQLQILIFQQLVSDTFIQNRISSFFFVALSPPLYLQFNDTYTEERQALEKLKEASWNTHFTVYGRGSMMYRTNELYELIFQGIPDSLRNELWLIFSGAIHDVSEYF